MWRFSIFDALVPKLYGLLRVCSEGTWKDQVMRFMMLDSVNRSVISSSEANSTHKGRYLYLEVLLHGGAPWGFTLKGGLEHKEPLIISKIEKGGKADLLNARLQPGDEVILINEVYLSSSRQKAISLVKGSWKTLKLVVRRDTLAAEGHSATNTTQCPNLKSNSPSGKTSWLNEVKLRLKNRQSDPVGYRSHSWQPAKFPETPADLSMMQISQGTISSPWHQAYHPSSSTNDLSNFDHGFLRRSPDQYSSRGSMESLDHLPAGYAHPSCHLSPAKSTSSIDQLAHLHSKRDSAYSSFSTSSSTPEYQLPPFCKERSYSMENVHSRARPQESGMRQADIRYIKTVYNAQRGVSEEYEVKSSALVASGEAHPKAYSTSRPHGHHKVPQGRNSLDNESQYAKGPPMPPTRSDSYAATRHHDRPTSWSSHEQRKALRTHSKNAWLLLGQGAPPPGQLSKPGFLEGQLHTVMERSPEGSPTMKPKQGYPQATQPGQPLLPTGVYPVPSPEPHFAQVPHPSANNSGLVYPVLAKESGHAPPPASFPASYEKAISCKPLPVVDENGNQSIPSKATVFYHPECGPSGAGKKKMDNETPKVVLYRTHPQAYPTSPRQEEEAELPYTAQPNIQESANDAQYLNHAFQPWSFHLRDAVAESKAFCPSKAYTSEEQPEDWNANLPINEGDPAAQNPWNPNKAKQFLFSSLQNIPESAQLQNPMDLKEAQPGRNCSGAKWHLVNYANQEEKDIKEQAPEYWQEREWRATEDHRDATMSADYSHGAEPNYEEPSSPLLPKTSDFRADQFRSCSNNSFQPPWSGKKESRKTRCSVLEKVSKIERREQGHPRPQSANSLSQNSKKSGVEDSRRRHNSQEYGQLLDEHGRPASTNNSDLYPNVLYLNERSTGKPEKANRYSAEQQRAIAAALVAPPDQQSTYRHGGSSKESHKKSGQLQRSRSTFQLLDEPEREVLQKVSAKEPHGSQREINPVNRTYRNSIKDAQSKVLRATSFRRKDLNISPAFGKEVQRSTPRPASALTGMRSTTASPHTPKERHSITPTEIKMDPINKDGLPGPLHVHRIGGRKRLTSEQKKRSYSEPEKMNEIGVSDNDLSPSSLQKKMLQFVFQESTVADRRKIFEKENKASSTINLSRPELKQLQQNALADYIKRKIGKRPSSASQEREGSQTPCRQTNGQESQSLSPASSMNSLQDQSLFHTRETLEWASRMGHVYSPLPGLHGCFNPVEFESKMAGPPNHGGNSKSSTPSWLKSDGRPDHRVNPELTKSTQTDLDLCTPPQPVNQILEKKTRLTKKPGKSASAEDLLDRTENQPMTMHVRSRSSPSADKMCQDFQVEDSNQISHFMKDPFYVLGATSRSFGNSKRGHLEKSAFTQYRPHHSSENVGSTAPAAERQKVPDILRHHSRTSAFVSPCPDTKEKHSDAKQGFRRVAPSKTSYSSRSPAFSTPTLSDFPAAGDNAVTRWPPRADKEEHSKAQSQILESVHQPSKEPAEETTVWRSKSTSSQRQQHPAKMKWARENHLPKSSASAQTTGQKVFQQWHGIPSKNSSFSEPESLSGQGRFSLRISETYPQISPPPFCREEDDDDVFLQEAQTHHMGALSDYPPLPESPVDNLEEFPSPPPSVAFEEDNPASDSSISLADEKITRASVLDISGRYRTPHPARAAILNLSFVSFLLLLSQVSLNEKRKMLASQHEDARELKENLDRRERVVLDILCSYLSEDQLQDYQHFVKMKSGLLIEQRELDDKIKLGQEQLKCLLESLPTEFFLESKMAAEPPAIPRTNSENRSTPSFL
ncbi:PREDICTED: protein Shroom3-like [Thamnophis sirtalis]|uniref:Protein Shroom3-like n=2 Tax=Thamnophis sirtalis TaxID=35019 RepID=A0A6I9XUH8_9SAUR|nr:PREDICTED: protein Shroom3-like [Thamnophis sirtalis]